MKHDIVLILHASKAFIFLLPSFHSSDIILHYLTHSTTMTTSRASKGGVGQGRSKDN